MAAKANRGRTLKAWASGIVSTPLFPRRIWSFSAPVTKMARLAEFAAYLLIAILLAKLVWTIFAPLSLPQGEPVQIASPAAPRKLTIQDPFSVAPPSESGFTEARQNVILTETSLDLTLYGTWIDASGVEASGGTAFIGEGDGPQKRFRTGDEITPGVRLRGVYENWVSIARNGVEEALWLKNRKQSGIEHARAAVSGIRLAGDLGDIFQLSLDQNSDGGPRIVLHPGRAPDRFAALGFVNGDILVEIDGAPVERAAIASNSIAGLLANKNAVQIIVERAGARKAINVDLTRQADDEKVNDDDE